MARIREFDAGNVHLNPSETGTTARAATARRVGAFFNQLSGATDELAGVTQRLAGQTERLAREQEAFGHFQGALERGAAARTAGAIDYAGDMAVRAVDHAQISQGAAALAGLVAGKTKEWDDTVKNADPNDGTVAKKFLNDSLEPDLEKFKQGFLTERGQAWAEAHVDQFRRHMFTKTAGDMGEKAAQATAVNQQQTVNSLSNTVRGDPSSLDFALSTYESSLTSVVASSPNLTGTTAAKVHGTLMQRGKEAIVKSAAFGYIEKTGEVPEWATDPKYAKFIDGAELKQLAQTAKVYARAGRAEERQARAEDQRQRQEAVETERNKIWADNVTWDASTGRPIIRPDFFKQAVDLPGKHPNAANAATTAKTLLDWGEHQQRLKNEPVADDTATVDDVNRRMFDQNNPVTELELIKANADGKLSDATFKKKLALVHALDKAIIQDPIFKNAMNGAKSTLGTDPIGKEKFSQFFDDFAPQYQALKRAGKLQPNALDLKDPDSLISQAMKAYRRDPMQIMLDRQTHGLSQFYTTPQSASPTSGEMALPAVKDRVKDQVYQTPSGPMRWTGTGWLPAQ